MVVIQIITFFCPPPVQAVVFSYLPLDGPGMWLPPWLVGF